ncbi:hypothetical protein WN55_07501 [Dufourea novaeangliae]|uniref:Uncharacterized protein n=1 Tax=Dufourea novaeangliae TaxID=178035 RepID=A0A154PS70_DUFNO|nr:hypothetical protein WN55_07501 [Dufourea novaeangliae]
MWWGAQIGGMRLVGHRAATTSHDGIAHLGAANIDQGIVDSKETDEDPCREPSNCYYSDCPVSKMNIVDHYDRGLLPFGRAFGSQNSISSLAVSLPEVKTHPRTCSTNELDRFSSISVGLTVSDSTNSCHEKLKRHGVVSTPGELTGTRQVDQRFKRCINPFWRDLICYRDWFHEPIGNTENQLPHPPRLSTKRKG